MTANISLHASSVPHMAPYDPTKCNESSTTCDVTNSAAPGGCCPCPRCIREAVTMLARWFLGLWSRLASHEVDTSSEVVHHTPGIGNDLLTQTNDVAISEDIAVCHNIDFNISEIVNSSSMISVDKICSNERINNEQSTSSSEKANKTTSGMLVACSNNENNASINFDYTLTNTTTNLREDCSRIMKEKISQKLSCTLSCNDEESDSDTLVGSIHSTFNSTFDLDKCSTLEDLGVLLKRPSDIDFDRLRNETINTGYENENSIQARPSLKDFRRLKLSQSADKILEKIDEDSSIIKNQSSIKLFNEIHTNNTEGCGADTEVRLRRRITSVIIPKEALSTLDKPYCRASNNFTFPAKPGELLIG